MESHPSHPILANLLEKYPRAASGLFQAYNDIVYAQQWQTVQVVDLDRCERGAIQGKKKDTDTVLHVVPCSLSETVSFAWLQAAFAQLSTKEIYLGITSEDASIVYYKISQGIVKPPV
ncbi:uncharacterized protein LACBIDRAFT_312094 [Laccaria bicolor S238N-H82]|uniref:Predicted protein n=1 Tax=Laccaria bicolor (strain S238N-H82 / ATCC MYA-4686) TaxID=486041 RepID=B0CZ26_LACBS|nr:uncharacterized protein LACBIDRAFT_312094 [Laccaria bicolor S238N-H82]EDR12989.1 predicted protein [Laccaria bicolor S238N-H82]|eukprot:XP_001877253.1 predicted protein [Laccaria bicolor S238N-H82]